ncbi:uncharacterized protein LOC126808696 [Patella vulgata]|uniref:uncharacterized protein LOC126808696 n=1 Tax=Patella vulgata TaxID=6465 RepID=UPI0024A8F85C|nr:uncharacterized protein LOC126808696 [Patella vulgata]
MANPKCVFEFKKKAKFTPSNDKNCLRPENVKSKEDIIEIRNGIDGIPIHANSNVRHSENQLHEFAPTDVGSDGIPTSKLSIMEIQTEEATIEEAEIEQVLQTLDGINNFESSANEVKMENLHNVTADGDVMNAVISIEIKNNEISTPDVQMDNVTVNNLLSSDLANTEDTSDEVENTSVHSNAVSLSGDENEEFPTSIGKDVSSNKTKTDENPTSIEDNANDVEIIGNYTGNVTNASSNNNKTDENPTSIDDNANDVEIIGNCTGNVTKEESINGIENNKALKNDVERNLESGDAKMDNNVNHQDTRLIEPNESENLSHEVVLKNTDLLQTVQNIHSRSITLLIQPTETKNTGILNSGYRDGESGNYAYATGAKFGDTGTEDTDDSFSGDQVSGPGANCQPKDCSTYYTGSERLGDSDQLFDGNLFNKKNPKKKKRVSVVNENMQPNENQSGADNLGFLSDDDSIDTVVDISKLPRRSIRFSIYSALKFPSEPKWQRKLCACVVVFCGFWNCFFSMGIAFSMGTFLPAWLDEFNDGRAKTAMIQSVLVGVTFGAGILIGISIDRYGVRLTIFVGSLMSCCGFLGAIFCPSTTTLLLSVAILPGLGLSAAQLGSIVAVSIACKRSVSVAIGLITAGGGLGSSILPYFFQFLIDNYGWRGAFFVIAGLSLQPLVFGFLMTAFMDQVTASRGHRLEKEVVTAKEKMKLMCRPEFITAVVCVFTAFSAANGFLFIIVDYANTKDQNGVFFLFLMTIISTCGRLAFGFLNLLSFFNSRILLTIAAILSGGSLICLGFVTQYARILGILVVLGFSYGGQIGIYGVVILDLVGPQTFSLALGLCATLNGTGSAIGGVIYGLLFDMSGSYSQPCIIMGTVCCVFGVLPIFGFFYSKIKTNCKSTITSD